jgi:hypothetical protein
MMYPSGFQETASWRLIDGPPSESRLRTVKRERIHDAPIEHNRKGGRGYILENWKRCFVEVRMLGNGNEIGEPRLSLPYFRLANAR